jgi:hypothetical protein
MPGSTAGKDARRYGVGPIAAWAGREGRQSSERFRALAANGGWFRQAEMPGSTAGKDARRYGVGPIAIGPTPG